VSAGRKQVMVFPFTVALDGAGNMRDPAQGIYARSFARALGERLSLGEGVVATAATLTSHGVPGEEPQAAEGEDPPEPDPTEHGWVVASQPWTLEEALQVKLPEGTEYLLHGASELTDRVRLRLLLVDQPRKQLALDHVVLRPRGELFSALDEAARTVASALGQELPEAPFPTRDVEAFVAWLRGRDMSAAHEAGVHVSDPQRSFDGYLEALRRDPRFGDAEERLLSLALDFSLGGVGPVEAARQACERLLAQDKKAYKAWAALAEMDLAAQAPEEAAKKLRALLAIKDDWWPAFERLGTALLRLKQYGEAKEWFDKALAERPDDIDALLGAGICNAEQGKLAEAVDHWRRAQAAGHQSVALHENLARALQTLERYKEARAERAAARELRGYTGPLGFLKSLWHAAIGKLQGQEQQGPQHAHAHGDSGPEREE
jgi:tetratricopeptide (TPR) repeat protein